MAEFLSAVKIGGRVELLCEERGKILTSHNNLCFIAHKVEMKSTGKYVTESTVV